jgi:O-antigen/teichoic acid export membrane protein
MISPGESSDLFFNVKTMKSFFQSPGFQKYFFNISWLMLEKIIRIFLGIFIGAWVARYLGPENYGILGFAISFVSLFGTFTTLGLDWIAVRNLIVSPEEKDEILGTSLVLRLFGTSLLFLLVWGALQATSSTSFEKKLVMVIAFGQIFMSFDVIDYYFRATVKGKLSSGASLGGFLVGSFLRITFILLKLPLIWFAGIVVIEQIAKVFFFLLLYSKDIQHKFWNIFSIGKSFSVSMAFNLMKDAWSIVLSGLAISFYMKIDQILVKEILGNEAIGYYSIAVKLSESWLFLTVAITESLYPAILNAKTVSQHLYYSRLQKMYQVLMLIAVSIGFLTSFLAKPLVLYLYGDFYAQSIDILIVYIWSNVFVFLNNGSWRWYVTENLQHIALIRLSLGAIANLVLSILFINIYGLNGVAYATLISYAIANYFGNLISKKTRINFKLQTLAILNLLNFKSYFR